MFTTTIDATRTTVRTGLAAILAVLAAVSLAAQPAFAGKPVFKREKPHVNIGTIPRPSSAPINPTLVFRSSSAKTTRQPVLRAPRVVPKAPRQAGGNSTNEYKYVPVRRTANEVAIQRMVVAHEGFTHNGRPAPRHLTAPAYSGRIGNDGATRMRFGDGRTGG